MNNEYIQLEFIKLTQPIGEFYIAKISAKDLLHICYADIRQILHEGNFETYLGIQRELDPKRIKELAVYVNLLDSTFPTSIILSVSNKKYISEYSNYNVEVDNIFDESITEHSDFENVKNIYIGKNEKEELRLFIRRDENVAKIIDGQHRIEGLKHFQASEASPSYEVNITVFIDMDIEEQAIVFSTINKAQTKVNKSRVYDLYDLATSRSPIKTAHNIAKFLNQKEGSPFIGLIKILGKADDISETITQATFVECILQYISANPMLDRDIIKRGDKIKYPKERELRQYLFRKLFIEAKDAEISKNIFNYFNAIKETWPTAWKNEKAGDILNTSTGLVAFFRFFSNVYLKICEDKIGVDAHKAIGAVFSKEEYLGIILPLQEHIKDGDFNKDNYVPGGSGRSLLYKTLKNKSNL